MTVQLESRRDITLAAVDRAAWQEEDVRIADDAMRRMADCKASFLRLLDDPDIVIYGVTSGYGQHARLRLTADERKAQATRAPMAAATTFGTPLPARITRAIVLARLSNFLDGHAAVSPHVAAAVAAMLNGASLPPVPVRGNGGAGEIQALSHLFGPLASGLDLAEKDALALINGSPCAAALVADAALSGRRRLALAEEVFALSAEAVRMPLEHVAEELETLWDDPHDAAAVRRLRELLTGADGDRRPYQAPVSFRILPRMLGRLRRAVAAAEEAATNSLSSVSDNPVYLPPEPSRSGHANGRIMSTGGYHNAAAWPAMDELAACFADLCTIADRHGARLLHGAHSLLPDQLMPEETGYLGCIPMAQVGWGQAARHAAQRTFLPGSESGGFGQNDVAPPNFDAWERQDDAGRMLDAAMAGLAIIAARALAITGRAAPGPLAALMQQVNDNATLNKQHPPGPEIEKLAAVFEGRLYPDVSV